MSVNGMVVASINDYPGDKYNRLFPSTLIEISPLHKVIVNIVQVDSTPEKKEVYPQKTGGFSLTKTTCLMLMTAANAVHESSKKILPQACGRCTAIARETKVAPQCHSCDAKGDVAYEASVLVPDPAGGYRRYIGQKEISKQDFISKNGGAAKAPVEHMAAQCETKALLRALRAGLGLKGAYTKEELEKPFAVAVVVPNTSDPELKAALIQRFAQGNQILFGASQNTVMQIETSATPEHFTALTEGSPAQESAPIDVTPGPVTRTESAPSFSADDFPPDFGSSTHLTCEGVDCGAIIEEFTDANQKHWTAEDLAALGKEKFEKQLCASCLKKAYTKAAKGGAK